MIRGKHGKGRTTFETKAWDAMSASARVLAIHERLRHITGGERFSVYGVTRKGSC